MKANTIIILLLFLTLVIPVFGQYKNVSIGAAWGTREFKENLNSAVLNLQYNTKNIFSFRTGVFIDSAQKTVSDNIKSHPVDHYVYHEYKNEINSSHFSIPFMAQASIGSRFYLTLFGGGVYSGLLTKPYVKTTTYLTDWQNGISKEQVDYSEGKVTTNYNNEFNIYCGAGFCLPLKSGITLNTEFSIMRALKIAGHNRYSVFTGPRFQFGVAYQLNLKKDSDYKFSTYSLKIRKSTDRE